MSLPVWRTRDPCVYPSAVFFSCHLASLAFSVWHFVAQNDFMWSGDYFHLNATPIPLPHHLVFPCPAAGTVATTSRRIFMGIERVPPPCALFNVFAAFWCLLVVSSTSMAPFVFMSSSINPCLHNHTHTHIPAPLFGPTSPPLQQLTLGIFHVKA